MHARPVQKKDRETVAAEFPIVDLVDGWFFRQRETSAGAYVVEGMDLWGRRVARSGDDPNVLLEECANDARRISKDGDNGLA